MSEFFASDHHFGHKNIINYAGRPFNSVKEMNEKIIEYHNSVVRKEDTIYMLGDMFFKYSRGEIQKTLDILNGKKIIIRGNHDDKSNSFYRDVGFIEIYDNLILFDKYFLTHYPVLPNFRPRKDLINIFGHIHEKIINNPNSICVCLEKINYKPISLEEIKNMEFNIGNYS